MLGGKIIERQPFFPVFLQAEHGFRIFWLVRLHEQVEGFLYIIPGIRATPKQALTTIRRVEPQLS